MSTYTPVSQTQWDALPTEKIGQKFIPGKKNTLKFHPHWKITLDHHPHYEEHQNFGNPHWIFALQTIEFKISTRGFPSPLTFGAYILS